MVTPIQVGLANHSKLLLFDVFMCPSYNYHHISNFKSIVSSTTDKVEQTVAFSQQTENVKHVIESQPDPTYQYGCPDDVPLGQFLSRPIKIHEIIWNTSPGNFDNTIDPWTLVITNATLRRRMEGFKLLSAKLHVRCVINGNPFLYGLALMAYTPRLSQLVEPTSDRATICALSMRPHALLNPTGGEAVEMQLPFFCPENWIDLAGTNIAKMGRLRFKSINDLKHANAASGSVQITVFAWFDQVKLAAPTQTNYNQYTSQAGEYAEEGVVSKPASHVAHAMGVLANIPVLKPYALATEMLASNIGKFASIFGYSRPPVVDNLIRNKPQANGILPNVDQHEAIVKLSLDSKQELSVDPRTVGLGSVDEMTLSSIVTRPAYVKTVLWSQTQTDGTVMASLNVNPLMYVADSNVGAVASSIINTPMSTVASCFKYWKGTLRFRFQVIASALHRGRLRLYYDPVGSTSEPSYNQSYSRIIDLSTERDFTLDVSWNSHTGWLSTGLPTMYPPRTVNNVDAVPVSFDHQTCNGVLYLTICNALTAPDPTIVQDVYVNIYVSANDDFQVACPSDFVQRGLTYRSQSGFVSQSGLETTVRASDNESIDLPKIGTWQATADPSHHVFMGESVVSIRALLRRYCFHSMVGSAANFWWREYNFPYYPGNIPAATNQNRHTGLSGPLNICGNTFLHWIVPCYAAWRGALRSKYIAGVDTNMTVRRDFVETGIVYPVTTNFTYTTSNDTNSKMMWLFGGPGFSGMQVASTTTDGALEIEFPFYSNKRFADAQRVIYTNSQADVGPHTASHVGIHTTLWGSSTAGIQRFISVGDDFTTFFWLGQPLLFYGDIVFVAPSEDPDAYPNFDL